MDYNVPVVQNFFSACKEVAEYYKINLKSRLPANLDSRYFIALSDYRRYLDSIDIKMPRARYPYDKNDTSTHAYLDVIIKTHKKFGRFFIRDVPNPNWKYRKQYERDTGRKLEYDEGLHEGT